MRGYGAFAWYYDELTENVSYEKRADFDTAKSLMADFLAAYPENTAAQRENTFLQNR